MMKVSILSLVFICLLACNSGNPPSPKNVSEKISSYLTSSDIQNLANEVDFIDIIFYQMDISVSQGDKASTQQTTHFLTADGKPTEMNCPAIGRLTLQAKGKIIREADIHVQGGGCAYFTLIENKKPVGTCLISPDGRKFFDSLLASYQPPK